MFNTNVSHSIGGSLKPSLTLIHHIQWYYGSTHHVVDLEVLRLEMSSFI
jgi:hypothetical protein